MTNSTDNTSTVTGLPTHTDRAATVGTAVPPKRRSLLRVAVLAVVTCALVAGLAICYLWISYRLTHTVIKHAAVKGRIYKVGARIEGQVKSVEVLPGQQVVKDQVLIRLVDDRMQAVARQAQAQLQSAVKRLEVEKLAIEQQRRQLSLDIERADNVSKASLGEVEAATSIRDKWEREYDRVGTLIKSGTASISSMDSATAERDNARALLKTAQGHLAAAESACQMARAQLDGLRIREAGLQVMESEIDLARERVAVAEADIAATVVSAPADGWVVDRIVEPGGAAKVGEPMISLWLGAPWIEAWVKEEKLSGIKIGSDADVRITAFPNRKLRGRVESIGVLTDRELQGDPVPPTLHSFAPAEAMIPICIAVTEDGVRLQPGLSAIVGISDETAEGPQRVAGLGDVFFGWPRFSTPKPTLGIEETLKQKGTK